MTERLQLVAVATDDDTVGYDVVDDNDLLTEAVNVQPLTLERALHIQRLLAAARRDIHADDDVRAMRPLRSWYVRERSV